MKFLALDFEFSRVTHEKVNLVSCATTNSEETRSWWLHNDPKEQQRLLKYLKKHSVLVAYSAIAEGRSLLSLGANPLEWQWIDLFLEYRCLSNHSDELNYGPQLVDGRVKHTRKPLKKWDKDYDAEDDKGSGFKPTHSLAEASYKLLNVIRDTEHKNKMRDLIISDPPMFTEQEREAIEAYGLEDVKDLEPMLQRMTEIYLDRDDELTESQLLEEMFLRGRYSAHTSIMESRGYPIDIEKTKNFSKHVAAILYDCQREINQLFPEIKPFKWDKLKGRFAWDQSKTREWIKTTPYVKNWELTDGGKSGNKVLSLSLEAFEKFYNFKHDYPTDNLGAQFVRYLKLKQNLYGFVPNPDSSRKNFWDFVGPDNRVRPYFNIYGAQSSRSQPSSTGFMFLKPAWMRALVVPAKGKAMAGIDYGSQEFLVSALEAGDENMIMAYLSGDVYLAFAKQSGMVPPDGKREDYPAERSMSKSCVLGMSYLMSKYGLAIKLTQDTGRTWTEEEAEELINKFYETYSDLGSYQENIIIEYKSKKFERLPCGYYMWGDNDNFRSVSNVGIQGKSASIMRKAVDLAVSKGLYVCKTLHDALYIEYDVGQEWQIKTLADCMREAFVFYFPEDQKKIAAQIKLDPFAWSPDYEEGYLDIEGWKVECAPLLIDSRSEREYEKFKKYFEPTADQQL